MTAEEIAAKLTPAQKRAVLFVPPAWGLPEGHNAWPLVEYDSSPPVEGGVVNECLRLGLLASRRSSDRHGPTLYGDVEDDPDITQEWEIDHTPLGLAVRAILESNHDRA